MKLFKKLDSLFGKKKIEGTGVSDFAKKLKRQPSYRASHMGIDSGKKPLGQQFKRYFKKWQRRVFLSAFPSGAKKDLKRPLLLASLLIVTLSSGYLFLAQPLRGLLAESRYFQVQEIEVSGCRVTNPTVLKKIAGINYQLNILNVEPEVLQQRLQNHPWIAQAKVRRIWPDKLNIVVKEYHPTAMVVHGEEGSFFYLDKSGKLFAPVELGQELDYPVITGFDDVGDVVDKEQLLAEVLSFLRLTQKNNPNLPAQNVSEIHLTEGGEWVLYLVKHPFPIYFGKGGVKRKYYQLRKVLEVLYRKRSDGALIDEVAYIRMDYQKDKVLVARNSTG